MRCSRPVSRPILFLEQKKKTGAVTSQYGKYGIIDESEFSIFTLLPARNSSNRGPCSQYNKAEEFRAWLVEERKINPETQSHDNVKREFAQFMEDYNTGSYCNYTRVYYNELADMSSDITPRKVLQHGFLRASNECPAAWGAVTCG